MFFGSNYLDIVRYKYWENDVHKKSQDFWYRLYSTGMVSMPTEDLFELWKIMKSLKEFLLLRIIWYGYL